MIIETTRIRAKLRNISSQAISRFGKDLTSAIGTPTISVSDTLPPVSVALQEFPSDFRDGRHRQGLPCPRNPDDALLPVTESCRLLRGLMVYFRSARVAASRPAESLQARYRRVVSHRVVSHQVVFHRVAFHRSAFQIAGYSFPPSCRTDSPDRRRQSRKRENLREEQLATLCTLT